MVKIPFEEYVHLQSKVCFKTRFLDLKWTSPQMVLPTYITGFLIFLRKSIFIGHSNFMYTATGWTLLWLVTVFGHKSLSYWGFQVFVLKRIRSKVWPVAQYPSTFITQKISKVFSYVHCTWLSTSHGHLLKNYSKFFVPLQLGSMMVLLCLIWSM